MLIEKKRTEDFNVRFNLSHFKVHKIIFFVCNIMPFVDFYQPLVFSSIRGFLDMLRRTKKLMKFVWFYLIF
jgi:hypothetical protein